MDINCPYCDAELEINHDDGFGYEEDVKHEMECCKCKKNFVFQTSVSYHYEADKADCLNGSNHTYELTHTFPKEFSNMRCSGCDDERDLTEDERNTFGINTKESYFESLNK